MAPAAALLMHECEHVGRPVGLMLDLARYLRVQGRDGHRGASGADIRSRDLPACLRPLQQPAAVLSPLHAPLMSLQVHDGLTGHT
jgi:hypothetical protein